MKSETIATNSNSTPPIDKKKRPTKEVYVPRGRRNLAPPSPTNETTATTTTTTEQQSDILIDPSIIGYLKNSPEKNKDGAAAATVENDDDDDLDKQMKSMSLKENNNDNDVDNVVSVDSWDNLFDDTGECTNKRLLDEVSYIS